MRKTENMREAKDMQEAVKMQETEVYRFELPQTDELYFDAVRGLNMVDAADQEKAAQIYEQIVAPLITAPEQEQLRKRSGLSVEDTLFIEDKSLAELVAEQGNEISPEEAEARVRVLLVNALLSPTTQVNLVQLGMTHSETERAVTEKEAEQVETEKKPVAEKEAEQAETGAATEKEAGQAELGAENAAARLHTMLSAQIIQLSAQQAVLAAMRGRLGLAEQTADREQAEEERNPVSQEIAKKLSERLEATQREWEAAELRQKVAQAELILETLTAENAERLSVLGTLAAPEALLDVEKKTGVIESAALFQKEVLPKLEALKGMKRLAGQETITDEDREEEAKRATDRAERQEQQRLYFLIQHADSMAERDRLIYGYLQQIRKSGEDCLGKIKLVLQKPEDKVEMHPSGLRLDRLPVLPDDYFKDKIELDAQSLDMHELDEGVVPIAERPEGYEPPKSPQEAMDRLIAVERRLNPLNRYMDIYEELNQGSAFCTGGVSPNDDPAEVRERLKETMTFYANRSPDYGLLEEDKLDKMRMSIAQMGDIAGQEPDAPLPDNINEIMEEYITGSVLALCSDPEALRYLKEQGRTQEEFLALQKEKACLMQDYRSFDKEARLTAAMERKTEAEMQKSPEVEPIVAESVNTKCEVQAKPANAGMHIENNGAEHAQPNGAEPTVVRTNISELMNEEMKERGVKKPLQKQKPQLEKTAPEKEIKEPVLQKKNAEMVLKPKKPQDGG